MKEYIITVADPIVWDTLWNELTVDGLGDNFIPQRAVEVVNERPFQDRMAHFNLTDQEAEQIRKDPRVQYVELQADLRRNVKKGFNAVRPDYNYNKSNSTTNTMKNWGLWRCIDQANPFSSSLSVNGEFPYNLDGTGVDLLVVDSGVEAGHPEFARNADGTGGTRVVDFNWAALGVPGTASSASIGGYLGDTDGHGSNCASIAAGNTCGWASGVDIYTLRIFSGNNILTGQYQGAIDSDIVFDIVKAFHLAKLAVGNLRPTICTNSWGYSGYYVDMVSTRWRGTTYATGSRNPNYGQVSTKFPYSQVEYLNISATDCAAAGVILVGASGNEGTKCDVTGGQDYNNYWTDIHTDSYYYQRGMSPTMADSMICVGAQSNSLTEEKVDFSQSGPRVDLYAPGDMIMGAYSSQAYATPAVPDPRNSSYYLNKISGTSQACPQVSGILACVLQARPGMTPTQALDFVLDYSVQNALIQTGPSSYSNPTDLQGGANLLLKTPFVSDIRGSMTSNN
jgi:hypothetical protein